MDSNNRHTLIIPGDEIDFTKETRGSCHRGSSSFPWVRVSGTDTLKRMELTGVRERERERELVMHLDTRWFISRSLFVLTDRKWITEGYTVT